MLCHNLKERSLLIKVVSPHEKETFFFFFTFSATEISSHFVFTFIQIKELLESVAFTS